MARDGMKRAEFSATTKHAAFERCGGHAFATVTVGSDPESGAYKVGVSSTERP
jgi:hypothetical protein